MTESAFRRLAGFAALLTFAVALVGSLAEPAEDAARWVAAALWLVWAAGAVVHHRGARWLWHLAGGAAPLRRGRPAHVRGGWRVVRDGQGARTAAAASTMP